MDKRQDIELLRIVGAFAIIWFHSGVQGHELSYAGLVFFLILSTYFAGKDGSARELLRRRFQRLLVPWIFWFAIYGLANVLGGRAFVPLGKGWLAGVLAGPSIHLWFMPFIFGCLVVLDAVNRHLPRKAIALSSAALAILVLAGTPLWRPYSLEFGAPVAQYLHALAAVFIGTFLLYFDAPRKELSWFLLVAMLLIANEMVPYPGVGIPYLIGIALAFVLASRISAWSLPINVTPLSKCTLGIYFVHVLLLKTVAKSGLARGVFVPLAAFALSIAVVFSFQRAFPRLARFWS